MAEKSPSLATQAYHTIKENILNLTYPPGMVLTEAMLTKELEMSRSPVRTAIQMLQVEGLIVSDYYKSMTVKEITDKDINEIYQLRELLGGAGCPGLHAHRRGLRQGCDGQAPAVRFLPPGGTKSILTVLKRKSCVCAPLQAICMNGRLQILPCIWRLSVFLTMTESTGSMKIIFPN